MTELSPTARPESIKGVMDWARTVVDFDFLAITAPECQVQVMSRHRRDDPLLSALHLRGISLVPQ